MIRWRASGDLPLFGRPSPLGLVLGAVFFAASLTPSLIPRAGLIQGVLGGISFAAGYLLGWAVMALWFWMVEPRLTERRLLWRNITVAGVIAVLIGGWGLLNATGWQNGIHTAMNLPPVESARPFTILGVALVLATLLIFIGRLFRRLWRFFAAQLEPFVPRRVATAIGLASAFFVFWGIGNDVILGRVLAALDETYAAVDTLIPPDEAPPSDPRKSGSPQSLVAWDGLGAKGRLWVSAPPDAAAIAGVTGAPAVDPLRVYVGLNSADTPEDRADLALREAIRAGAFERGTLVIVTPTGTGWMDPAGMQPLEYLTGGDVATVAVQYSYLASWMSLFLQPEYGSETARAVFRAFYRHWTAMPRDARPKLYLFGLSLGVRNTELAVSFPELLGDPVQGMLFAGPPFAAAGWREILISRQPGTPEWAPLVGDGSVVRVMTRGADPNRNAAPWGAVRILYLEHASDPIVFFSTDILWRRPDWMREPRGPGLSSDLRWVPVVTFLQMGFDMMTATTTPPGRGHVYAASDYVSAWVEVLASDWPAERIAALQQRLTEQGL